MILNSLVGARTGPRLWNALVPHGFKGESTMVSPVLEGEPTTVSHGLEGEPTMVSHGLERESIRNNSQERRSSSPSLTRTQSCNPCLRTQLTASVELMYLHLSQRDCFGDTDLPASFFSVSQSMVPAASLAKSLLSRELCLLSHLTSKTRTA